MKNNYTIKDNMVEMEVYCKGEKLITLIDIEFLPVLEYINTTWYAHEPYTKSRNLYVRGKFKRRPIFLHQIVCGNKEGLVIDHINRNSLDNRKENLRNVTHQENMLNSYRAKN